MVATFLQLSRRAATPLVCVGLIAIACSGDAPYAPLGNDKAPHAAIVGGTVRNMSEEPVIAAVVTLEPMEDGVSATAKWMRDRPGATSEGVPARRVTLTSESGQYAFDEVADGEYVLHVLADDHLGAFKNFTISSPIALADTVIINVDLTPTGKFSGNAFLENATTHANTIVYVQGTSYVGVTNPAGGYTISDVPVGNHTVRATHPGYLDETRAGTIATAGQVVALSDMTLLIDRNIPPTATASAPSQTCELDPVQLSGTGTDADGVVILYEWDFEDDGTVDYEDSTSADVAHSYTPGTHRAKLTVTDDKGAIGLAVVTFATVKADTVYVAATGNDANPGTRSLPKLTINAGLAAAVQYTVGVCPAMVLVAGNHVESPSFLPDMRVFGGYDASTWTRSQGTYSVVDVQTTPALVDNINTSGATTVISGFEFQAGDGQGGMGPTQRNSIAARVVSSNAVTFDDCRFLSKNAAAGPNGVGGTAGGNGGAGSSNGAGPSGGPGGVGGSPAGLAGGNGGPHAAPGTAGGGGCGTGGTAGQSTFCSGGAPGNGGGGLTGCSGTHGANGAAQTSYGSAGSNWTPLGGFSGLNGTAGGGGGGGGGGGDYFPDGNPACPFLVPGAGGGGGGGGGGYGTSGSGGDGGGASFAVYLSNSSPSFVDCHFTTGAGGAGGTGGNGGSGGNGGDRGLALFCCAGQGGNGGFGGPGGHGGAGSGGPGGPSYGVYRAGVSTPTLTGSVFVVGSGGTGGAAGVRPDSVPAAAGLNGPAGTVGP